MTYRTKKCFNCLKSLEYLRAGHPLRDYHLYKNTQAGGNRPVKNLNS